MNKEYFTTYQQKPSQQKRQTQHLRHKHVVQFDYGNLTNPITHLTDNIQKQRQTEPDTQNVYKVTNICLCVWMSAWVYVRKCVHVCACIRVYGDV